jgi:hypothetical protein
MKKLLLALVTMIAVPVAWAAGDATPPALPPVQGEVLEVLEAEAFTYLRLKTAKGETWAAVRRAPVKKGMLVTINDPVVTQNFESKSLKRTFDTLAIGTLAGPAGVASAAAPTVPGAPPAQADLNQIHGGLAKAPDADTVKVAKAEGRNARTVAEVHANRLALKDQPVVIRAKVVKVTPSVMGKTWVHLRDGSGLAADQSNDLVATSKDEPKTGDVVIAKGVVRTDVNLGSGYAYRVLVEDVSFQK